MKISGKLDEFTERQGIVSAEWCKLLDQVGVLEQYNEQLVNKIKLLDALKKVAEFQLRDALKEIRRLNNQNPKDEGH